MTATGLSGTPPDAQPVQVESVMQPAGRPRGVRFGALLHGILRDTELAAGREQVEELAAVHGKLLGATEAEVTSGVDAVLTTVPLGAASVGVTDRHIAHRTTRHFILKVLPFRRRRTTARRRVRSCLLADTGPTRPITFAGRVGGQH